MIDRRSWPANDRVAHESLRDQVAGLAFVAQQPRRVSVPVADLCDGIEGALDRQMLAGDQFNVLETRNGWSFGTATFGSYVGWVKTSALGPEVALTHWISALRSHGYAKPDMKSTAQCALPLGAGICVEDENGAFWRANGQWFPKQQVSSVLDRPADFVTCAEACIGTPYLWGGDSPLGLDCSGLVALALRCVGQKAWRDSDQQAHHMGTEVSYKSGLRRGDLVFWHGHVGVMQDATHILHANAHHMMVTSEPLEVVVARAKAGETGPVTCVRRLENGKP